MGLRWRFWERRRYSISPAGTAVPVADTDTGKQNEPPSTLTAHDAYRAPPLLLMSIAQNITQMSGDSKDPPQRAVSTAKTVRNSRPKSTLSRPYYVLVALRFFAVGSYQRGVGQEINLCVSQSSVSRCVKTVSDAMVTHLLPKWIKFPNTNAELLEIKRGFMVKYGFPGVIGAIDCTHVRIIAPTSEGELQQVAFMNRKGTFSINVQMPADNESVEDPQEAEQIKNAGSLDNLSILSHSMLPQGRVSFWKEFSYEIEGRPYVRVSADTPMEELAHILAYEWKMYLPSIVLVVISSMKQYVDWSHHKQWSNLQKGLIEAAKNTRMWIVTHGANSGVAKMLGSIVKKEEEKRRSMRCHRHPKHTTSKLPNLTLMGIIREDSITYDHLLDGKTSKVEVENEGNHDGKYDLNPEHTHFIIVKDGSPDQSGGQKFTLNLEKYLLHNTDNLPDRLHDSVIGTNAFTGDKATIGTSEIPVIGLLISGGDRSTMMVLEHVKREVPVVVIKGSGGAANLMAFAYEEIKEKARGDWDPDYVENFIKSELSKKIAVSFPQYRDNNLARNKFRDRILECIRHAHKDDRVLLTFLDIHNHTVDLSELNQHLLRALFKATVHAEENTFTSYWYEHLQKDLYLTLDWNIPHIALSEVFEKNIVTASRFKVDKRIFETALLRPDREMFVELFLDQGFQVHKFLSDKRLRRLFEKAENPEFFRTVCLEGALGYSFSLKIGKDFIQNDFNWLIKHLTKLRNLVDAQELANNCMGMYTVDPAFAERKAQTLLALWAVVMDRPKLAKVLWKRTDYPIHLALVISLMYTRLVAYVRETHLIKDMEDRSKEFADMAVGVLDTSFQQNNCRAFDILSEEITEWNCKTAVEIAADARNRTFIAHPCCQKWLTNMFFGDIRIRELKWGPIPLPIWMKVVLSAFLLFPMYIWVHFKTGQKRSILGIFDDGRGTETNAFISAMGKHERSDSDEESDAESDGDTVSQPPLSRMCSREGRHSIPMAAMANSPETPNHKVQEHSKTNAYLFKKLSTSEPPGASKLKSAWDWTMLPTVTLLHYFQPRPQPPIWKKISIMWNAPVTKFWTFQIFYIFYLGLFSLAVLVPGCGHFYLDASVWTWTGLILMENIRKTYIQYRKYSSIPLVRSFIEIFFISLFLFLYLVVRILPTSHYTNLDYHIPLISPYIARVVLCFGLLYFYYRFIWIYLPISPTLGPLLFRIKLMVTVDFVHFLRLTLLFIISGGIVIHAVIYPDYPLGSELLRRVFHRAWFTLFLTPIEDLEGDPRCTPFLHNRAENETCELVGKHTDVSCPRTGFVPYVMVVQYVIILKLILLTLLTALYSNTAQRATQDADAIWKFQRYHLVLDFNTRLRLPAPLSALSFVFMLLEAIAHYITCRCCKKKPEPDKADLLAQQRLKINDYNYWRGLALDYSAQEKERSKLSNWPREQMESVRTMMQNMEYHKWTLHQLKVRITELEKIMLSSRISLEEIKHDLNKEDSKILETSMHLLSRQSPYPGTRVKRFPLADRYVPWEVLYSVYDPVVYSKPRPEFKSNIREFVDEDLLALREKQGTFYRPPDFKWNFVFTSGGGITIDRRSWMEMEDGERIIYKLDSAGLPVNPMGRTGLRGRGSLCRWGPNHCILLALTRWRMSDPFMQSVNAAEESKALEFISLVDKDINLLSLPGGFMMGYQSLYEVIKQQFVTNQIADCWTAETMEHYFAQFARAPAGDFVDIVGEDAEQTNFTASMLMKGYLDDSRNTDNAWIEAEVWHFHYTGPQTLDPTLPPQTRWKKYTPNTNLKMILSHSAVLQEIHHRLENINA